MRFTNATTCKPRKSLHQVGGDC